MSVEIVVWGISLKKIASYLTESIFTEGYESSKTDAHYRYNNWTNAVELWSDVDDNRISIADARSFEVSKEGRVERRVMRSNFEETFYEEEVPLYEAGMAD